MAKKDPTDLSVEEKLKTLYQLQSALSSIDEQREIRGELPLEVQDLEDEIEGLMTHMTNIRTDIDELQNAINQKNKELTDAQTSVQRYRQQIDDVKNNREYEMLKNEIEFQELEINLCKKKIHEGEQQVAEKGEELKKSQETLNERREDLDVKRGELDDIIEETRAAEEKYKGRAKELEAKIEPRLLTSFKRIRKNAHNGLGIVCVQRDACGGCFNKIPPQRQLDVMMHKKIIVCEYCGRILIDPELAGVAEGKIVAEEKKAKKRATRRTTRKEEQK